MTTERGKYAWWILMILSCLFLVWTIFTISNGNTILENGLKMWADSSFDLGNVEEKALGFMNMAMIKPLWEELWIGIFGIFFALKLKQSKKYAWTLGVVWSAMMLSNGIIQGGYEMFILKWSKPCVQTYIFLGIGIIALLSLLVVKKGFPKHSE
jgi:hypothetical protein